MTVCFEALAASEAQMFAICGPERPNRHVTCDPVPEDSPAFLLSTNDSRLWFFRLRTSAVGHRAPSCKEVRDLSNSVSPRSYDVRDTWQHTVSVHSGLCGHVRKAYLWT